MIFRCLASRTYGKSKIFLTAFAIKESITFKDCLILREDSCSTAATIDEFIGLIALNTSHITAHRVKICILVVKFEAIFIGATKVIHAMIAICALYFLSKFWLVEEDSLFRSFTMWTYLQSPKLIATSIVTEMISESSKYRIRVFGCLPTFGTESF